jgi:hypothetical protein
MLLLLLACATTNPAVRDDQQQSQELTEAAGQYWRALRWGDAVRAKAFLEGAEVKLAFDEWLNAEGKDHKITDVAVLHVRLDPATEKPTGDHVREATVTIRTEGYAVSDLIVHEETVDQRWYRTQTGWFVVWP